MKNFFKILKWISITTTYISIICFIFSVKEINDERKYIDFQKKLIIEANTGLEKKMNAINKEKYFEKWNFHNKIEHNLQIIEINYFKKNYLKEISALNFYALIIEIVLSLHFILIYQYKFKSNKNLGDFNSDYLILVPLNMKNSNIIIRKILTIFFTLLLFCSVIPIILYPLYLFGNLYYNYELYPDKYFDELIGVSFFSFYSILLLWTLWIIISLIYWVKSKPD
jgi:hypothetical protein